MFSNLLDTVGRFINKFSDEYYFFHILLQIKILFFGRSISIKIQHFASRINVNLIRIQKTCT